MQFPIIMGNQRAKVVSKRRGRKSPTSDDANDDDVRKVSIATAWFLLVNLYIYCRTSPLYLKHTGIDD